MQTTLRLNCSKSAVFVVGLTGSGKSTLLNNLIGMPIFSTSDDPVTECTKRFDEYTIGDTVYVDTQGIFGDEHGHIDLDADLVSFLEEKNIRSVAGVILCNVYKGNRIGFLIKKTLAMFQNTLGVDVSSRLFVALTKCDEIGDREAHVCAIQSVAPKFNAEHLLNVPAMVVRLRSMLMSGAVSGTLSKAYSTKVKGMNTKKKNKRKKAESSVQRVKKRLRADFNCNNIKFIQYNIYNGYSNATVKFTYGGSRFEVPISSPTDDFEDEVWFEIKRLLNEPVQESSIGDSFNTIRSKILESKILEPCDIIKGGSYGKKTNVASSDIDIVVSFSKVAMDEYIEKQKSLLDSLENCVNSIPDFTFVKRTTFAIKFNAYGQDVDFLPACKAEGNLLNAYLGSINMHERRYFSSSFVLHQREIFKHACRIFRGSDDNLRSNIRILKTWSSNKTWDQKPISYVLELMLIYIYADYYKRNSIMPSGEKLFVLFKDLVTKAKHRELGIATFFDSKKLIAIERRVPNNCQAYVQDIANIHTNVAERMDIDCWNELLTNITQQPITFQ